MKKLTLVIGISHISIVGFSQTKNNGSTNNIEIQKNKFNGGYTIEMKDKHHRELAESMKNWSPDRIKAFKRVFVYGSSRGFEPISKDTLYYYYPSLKEN